MKYIILILYNLMLIEIHQSEFLIIILSLASFLILVGILASEPVLSYEKKYPPLPTRKKLKIFLTSISLIHTLVFIMTLLYPSSLI